MKRYKRRSDHTTMPFPEPALLKMLVKVLLLLISIAIPILFAQEIEYYPSNSAIKSGIKLNPRNNVLHKFDKAQKHKNSIRQFNTTRMKHPAKRAVDPVFHGHPKTREEQWNDHFLNQTTAFDQTPSLISLINKITLKYLNDCTPVILYDKIVARQESNLFQNLFKSFPTTFIHGKIEDDNTLSNPNLVRPVQECIHFILFLADITKSGKAIGMQATSKVVVVAWTSQWSIQEFLVDKLSRKFVNLLIIGQSFKDEDDTLEAPYILYTHKLYTDGLGSSQPVVLTSWTHGKFSREVDLFSPKMQHGYAGHRFVVAAANKPPFVFRMIKRNLDGGNPRVVWDGIEIRILQMLAERNNFSIEIIEPKEPHLGPGDAVAKEVTESRADIAIAGMYLTIDRAKEMDMSFSHSHDCAVFVTLMSTALPRYRAILGPFHWHVWVALTFTYLIGIFPLAFSDKHTLRHLLHNSGEVENMFWYVFGTFTNCFTFVGANSWSKTDKITTRLLIGWYWIFTIIITSCYTGSIIAFVTLPIFPETVDTIDQLLSGFYRIGTLDRGGWERWFFNSSDHKTNKLLRKIELLPDVAAGIRNTTKAFFWPYAFLGSKAELEYIVQGNFSMKKSKRAMLHISNECFVPFGVSFGFPNQSLYTAKLSSDIARMFQSGFLDKIVDEVRFEIQRSNTGKLLAATSSGSLKIVSAEEKGLTLDDTQGMFLLLAIGFLLGAASLISEWMGGCTRRCRIWRKKDLVSMPSSASTENLIVTPKTNVDSEIKIISNDYDSTVNFSNGTRSSTTESRQTLDGEIINVTEESIVIHNNLDTDDWDSRRSSSVDVDKEVRDIFERDQKRRRLTEGVIDFTIKREATASKGAFGDRINSG